MSECRCPAGREGGQADGGWKSQQVWRFCTVETDKDVRGEQALHGGQAREDSQGIRALKSWHRNPRVVPSSFPHTKHSPPQPFPTQMTPDLSALPWESPSSRSLLDLLSLHVGLCSVSSPEKGVLGLCHCLYSGLLSRYCFWGDVSSSRAGTWSVSSTQGAIAQSVKGMNKCKVTGLKMSL